MGYLPITHRTAPGSKDWNPPLAGRGCRRITHDPRGPGRSSQIWGGNPGDRFGDLVAELLETPDPKTAMMVVHSAGDPPPKRIRPAATPDAVHTERLNNNRKPCREDRAPCRLPSASRPLLNSDRPDSTPFHGMIPSRGLCGLPSGRRGRCHGIRPFSDVNLANDQRARGAPTPIEPTDDGRVVPTVAPPTLSAQRLTNSVLTIGPGGWQGPGHTSTDPLGEGLPEAAIHGSQPTSKRKEQPC